MNEKFLNLKILFFFRITLSQTLHFHKLDSVR